VETKIAEFVDELSIDLQPGDEVVWKFQDTFSIARFPDSAFTLD
jgi:hypothetical protein